MIGLPIMDKFDPCYPFPVPVSQHPCHHAVCQDFRSIAYGPGDMMYQGAVLGVRHTSLVAEAPVGTRGPSVKRGGQNSQGGNCTPDTQCLTPSPENLCIGTYRLPLRIWVRPVEGAPGKHPGAGNPDILFNFAVIRLQVLIGNGPVFSYTVKCFGTEVTLMETVKDSGKVYRASSGPSSGVIMPHAERVTAGNNAGIIPGQFLHCQFITGKIRLGIPERPGLNNHNFQTGPAQLTGQHTSCRTCPHNTDIHLFRTKFSFIHMIISVVTVMVTVVFYKIPIFHFFSPPMAQPVLLLS